MTIRRGGFSSVMRELLAAMKALADENRLRVVRALKGRELCLCQIVELLGLATSTVSRHMSILHQARLVESRKEGRWTYFRLDENAPKRWPPRWKLPSADSVGTRSPERTAGD